MANLENSELIEGLAETLGERIESKRKAREEVPAVYKSGMRGNEEPPAKRQEREAREKREKAVADKKKGVRPGVDPDKARRSEEQGGKRKISFEAGPSKKDLLKKLKALESENAQLKSKGKKKVVI